MVHWYNCTWLWRTDSAPRYIDHTILYVMENRKGALVHWYNNTWSWKIYKGPWDSDRIILGYKDSTTCRKLQFESRKSPSSKQTWKYLSKINITLRLRLKLGHFGCIWDKQNGTLRAQNTDTYDRQIKFWSPQTKPTRLYSLNYLAYLAWWIMNGYRTAIHVCSQHLSVTASNNLQLPAILARNCENCFLKIKSSKDLREIFSSVITLFSVVLLWHPYFCLLSQSHTHHMIPCHDMITIQVIADTDNKTIVAFMLQIDDLI